MAAELIDYLFIFWIVLVIAIYALGSLYDKQLKDKANQEAKRKQQQAWREASKQSNSQNGAYASGDYPPEKSSWSSPVSSPSSHHPADSKRYDSSSFYDYNGNNANQQTTQNWSSSQMANSYHPRGLSASHYSNETPPNDWRQVNQQTSAGYRPSFNDGLSNQPYNSANLYQHSLGLDPTGAISDKTIPTATGFNSDCVEWVNQVLFAFYTQPDKYGPLINESICRSLNEKLATPSVDGFSNTTIEFVGVNHLMSLKPELTNVRTETESDKSISVVCKIYCKRLVLDLSIRQNNASRRLVSGNYGMDYGQDESQSDYELTLENLEGKVKGMAMLNDKLVVIQFVDKPDTKITLRPKSNVKVAVNEDAFVGLILQTISQVVVDLYFGEDPDFPQFKHLTGYRNKLNMLKDGASELRRQIKQEFLGALSSSGGEGKERKVFVKVLRAKNINYNQDVTVIMEMDTPSQQMMTSTKSGSNPVWDEHFLFKVNDKSHELVVELWDSISKNLSDTIKKKWKKSNMKAEVSTNAKFLGLARVNIDELRKEPSQQVTLMLESKGPQTELASPGTLQMTTNPVGGEIQLELLFLEHSNQSTGGGMMKSNSSNSLAHQHGDVVSVERKLTPSGYVITTTTITKQSNANRQRQSRAARSTNTLDRVAISRNPSPTWSATEQSDLDLDAMGAPSTPVDLEATSQDRVSRPRSRSRSILRAIKKRFSFSRTRSRSVGEAGVSRSEAPSAMSSNLDAASIGSHSRASSDLSMGRAKSMPASRDPNELPRIVINKGRLSDATNAMSFEQPKSQLVIECIEPRLSSDGVGLQKDQTRHYAISEEMAKKSKWRRKNCTKLHIFNEHQFVACHLAGSRTCHLCGRVFSRRPGKQGYKCRNCHLLSHKRCHVLVDHQCPYVKRDSLKLEYIDADPPRNLFNQSSSSVSNLPGTSSSRANQLPNRQGSRLGAKSMSVDVDAR